MVLAQLHVFVELVFLRDEHQGWLVDGPGHSNKQTCLLNAAHNTLCRQEFLSHTSVILCHRPAPGSIEVIEELVYSSQYFTWGYDLPSCPRCGNHNITCTGRGKGEVRRFVVKCGKCRIYTTKGSGVERPKDVRPIRGYDLVDDRFFWRPLNSDSPWISHQWRMITK
jgi:hypothetical protein